MIQDMIFSNPMYQIYRNGQYLGTSTWSSGVIINYVISNLQVGIYNYTIIAYDGNGYSSQDEVFVTVLNNLPFFSYSSNISLMEGSTDYQINWTIYEDGSHQGNLYYSIWRKNQTGQISCVKIGLWIPNSTISYLIPTEESIGEYDYNIEINDGYENTTSNFIHVSITYSYYPKFLNNPPDVIQKYHTDLTMISWQVSSSFFYPINSGSYMISLNNTPVLMGTWDNNSGVGFLINYTIPNTLDVGIYICEIDITNGYYNKTDSVTITIENNLPMIITNVTQISFTFGMDGYFLNWLVIDDGSWIGNLTYSIYRNDSLIREGSWSNNTPILYELEELHPLGTFIYKIVVTDGYNNMTSNNSIVQIETNMSPTIIKYSNVQQHYGTSGTIISWNINDLTIKGTPTYTILLNNTIPVQVGIWISGLNVTYQIPSDLPIGTHAYILIASDGYNNIPNHNSTSQPILVQIGNPPQAPLLYDISPNPSSSGNITLNWTAISGAINYHIYRNPSPFTTIEGITPIATTYDSYYLDINLSNGTYYYRIIASNLSGNSDLSNIVSISVEITSLMISHPIDITMEFQTTGNVIIWVPSDSIVNNPYYNLYQNGNIILNGNWNSNQQIIINIDHLSVGIYNFTIELFDSLGDKIIDEVIVIVQSPAINNNSTINTSTFISNSSSSNTNTPKNPTPFKVDSFPIIILGTLLLFGVFIVISITNKSLRHN
jgi:hypothetical protein